jgi:YD repeat-containing protein
VVAPPWASVTDHRSNTSRYLLDNRGRLLVQDLPGPAGTPDSVSSYQRDDHGQVTVALDALGTPTFYAYVYGAYDPLQYGGAGDLIRVASADGSVRRYRYDSTFHQLTRASDGLFGVRTNTYDPVTGDRLSSTDWVGALTAYTWSAGLLQSSTDPLGHQTVYLYDSHRRLQAAIDSLGNWTVTSYDAAGNPATVRDALGRVTTMVYTGRNQLLATVDANGGVTSQVYLPDGQLASQTNARGFTTTTMYDQRGFATAVIDALGAWTTTTYDDSGNPYQVTDANHQTTTTLFDPQNRPYQTTDALGNVFRTSYDLVGDVVRTTDALGRVMTATPPGSPYRPPAADRLEDV